MAELLSEIGSSKPRSRTVFAALGTTGLNSLGGMAAGRLDGAISHLYPGKAHYPAVGIFLLSVGLRFMSPGTSNTQVIMREVAAGMAGWVGNDVWYFLRSLFISKWTGGQPYKLADKVKYNGKVYQAAADIAAAPLAEPGKDGRWKEVAQGFQMEEYREAAQALLTDDVLWQNVADLQAQEVAPAIAEITGEELAPEGQRRLVESMRQSLQRAVQAAAA